MRSALPAPRSIPDDLHQDPLLPAPVELPVEDLLPGAEIELSFGDGDHYLAAHDLPLVMCVPIVLSRPVVVIALGARIVGREPFQPARVVGVEARLVVVDEDAGG